MAAPVPPLDPPGVRVKRMDFVAKRGYFVFTLESRLWEDDRQFGVSASNRLEQPFHREQSAFGEVEGLNRQLSTTTLASQLLLFPEDHSWK
jgi:hypothetical protein